MDNKTANHSGILNSLSLSHLSGSFLANPKSVILIWPVLSIRIFSGFKSLGKEKEDGGGGIN